MDSGIKGPLPSHWFSITSALWLNFIEELPHAPHGPDLNPASVIQKGVVVYLLIQLSIGCRGACRGAIKG